MFLPRLSIFFLLQYRVELSHVPEFTGHKNVETTVGAVAFISAAALKTSLSRSK